MGGTWLLNRYPGCACDVPAHLYSLSFEPNPDWSEAYAGAEEIHASRLALVALFALVPATVSSESEIQRLCKAYIKRVYEKYNLAPHTRLNTRLTRAEWTPSLQRWRVTLESGEILQPRFLFGCAGILHHPKTPAVPGKDKFKGRMFHSAEWDRATDFSAKKVVVVGSGASAVQFVPIIAEPGRWSSTHTFGDLVGVSQCSESPELHTVFVRRLLLKTSPKCAVCLSLSLSLSLPLEFHSTSIANKGGRTATIPHARSRRGGLLCSSARPTG